ncbi:unnamed protein product [Clavelina lepadiformis]|uniref:Radial spoke head 10 homolog B-like n=1 Tax=Clavelina lepadiformis TaxID=159417 RepID=A0ABP0GMA2_CLALP
MAKGQKLSASREAQSSAKNKKNSENNKGGLKSQPNVGDDAANDVFEHLETKSVAESDSGRPCGDLLSTPLPQKVKESEYDEPPLSDIIVSRYEGDRAKTGHFEGQGEAWFIGGNKYKGYFSDGVMHGKGKYVWSDGMQYEGDMNNNQISGYGRYEWPDKSYYEGEVLNGLRHGVGVFKSSKHNVSYSGQWYLGKRHGRGIMHYSEHSWYEGDWVNNTRHGWGVRRYNTGNVFEGQWVNDKRHGEGTMRWLTTDESYSGIWENGVQHGCGTHTWYLHRVPGSQYPLRNEYVGDFINALRHGHGKFFFASGAVYNGEWENNKKHGWNGRVFEGQFENDHMVDHPSFKLDGNESPDLTNVRTRTPVGWEEAEEEMSKDGSGNLLGPSLTLEIDSLLDNFQESQRENELKQVTFLMLRNVSVLRRVYSFYSALGHDRSPDNTFVMTRFQFWRFLKDCRIHYHSQSLSEMDRAIAKCHASGDVHNPMEKLLLREFLTNCVVLGYLIYNKEEKQNKNAKTTVLSRCLQRLINEHILKQSCRVGGHFLSEPRRAVNALAYMDRSWHIYQRMCTYRKETPYEPTLCMRQFLFLLKDLKIIGPQLSTRTVLDILADDDPSVSDGDSCNMEIEMTFLEFFEALIGLALNFTPPAETTETPIYVEEKPTRSSRPQSSISQMISEAGEGNVAMSTDSLSLMDGESRVGSKLTNVLSKHSFSHAGGGSTGAFLHTLSQLSVHEDAAQAADDASSLPQDGDSHPNHATEGEGENSQENEFNIWCNKLNIFFTQHLFPTWNRLEALRNRAAKERVAQEEKKRQMSVEQEVQRRKLLNSQEPPEEPEPTPPPDTECSSAGMEDVQILETAETGRATASTASMQSGGKSGKSKRRK